jgi:hypothetical protein
MQDPLAAIVRELDRFEIPYMLAGSFASTYHGSPRTTHDIDVVIAPSREKLGQLVAGLDPNRFYVSEAAADEAWARRGMFNVVLFESGWKVDLILCKDRAFSRAEFARRQRVDLGGLEVWMATAEDTVVAKLEWARAGESERQLRDVIGILDTTGEHLEREYIEKWVGALGLVDLWRRVDDRGVR